MNLLVKSATIIDKKSKFHNSTQDILIENGSITQIAKNIKNPKNYKTVKLENLHVSQGWFDSSVSFGEPGFEERETIKNGLHTAALSGFTAVCLNANTSPVLDTSTAITYVFKQAKNHATSLYPIGALTKNSSGKQLAELFDMQNVKAVAFQDYKKPIANANLLKIALQYAKTCNALIYSYPQENSICASGVVNEHINSTKMGLKGIPNIAEALQINRDIHLLEYTNGCLHIPTISTAEAVQLIKNAKNKNLNISCSVAITNLFFTDDNIQEFNTNYKLLPPLRTKTDVAALRKAVLNKTIDMVTSDHNPLNIELKNVEFDHANFGSIGLECIFGALNTIYNTTETIEILTRGRSRFGIPESTSICKGNKANLTLFNPEKKYVFKEKHIISASKNCAFLNQSLKGITYGIINNNKAILKT